PAHPSSSPSGAEGGHCPDRGWWEASGTGRSPGVWLVRARLLRRPSAPPRSPQPEPRKSPEPPSSSA
ncbi:hypothetical protein P7K49_032042, partial [Saguinus oedipus]